MMKRNESKRNVQFLAAAALTAALITGQIQPISVFGGNTEIQVSSLIPDNITIDHPVPLSDISLPSSDYGTLSWADSSSIPSERVQSYDVVFRPFDSVDLSDISGWDGSSDAIYGRVTVVVSSLEENGSEEEYEDPEEWTEEGEEQGTGEEEETENEIPEEETESETEDTENGEEEIPEATVTPGAEETPEVTVTPGAEETPEATVTPGAEETPEATVTPGAEDAPEATVTPGAEETPEATVTPGAEETPEATVTPGAEETPEATVTPEITETPEPTITPEADKDNIFDREEDKDERPAEADKELSKEEQEEAAAVNHSCNGISVSGINLPWYVQFRATSGEDYQFSNEDEANVFKSYEFELWDLKNNTEYEIPDGEYISVTVPVKAGYTYTIEHLLDSGAMETIVPSVDGSTMVFSTHSFSPFGIAGSKPLVGEEIQEDGYDGTVRPTSAPSSDNGSGTSATVTPSQNNEGSDDASESGSSTGTSDLQSSAETEDEDQGDSAPAVNTGDNTPVGAFVVLAVAALVIVGVILYLRKRKNK